MIQSTPVRLNWEGEDAFIIGGGPSLRGFNFDFLKGKRTLGANDAFCKGPAICSALLFADLEWWNKTKWDVENYHKEGGAVYSVCHSRKEIHLPWLSQLTRSSEPQVSSVWPTLGWNFNTGAACVNLAYLFGARRIFLLGFDMCATPAGETHWHNYSYGPPPKSSYARFLKGFEYVALGMKQRGIEVFNVTDGTTKLELFPKMGFKDLEGQV